MPDEAGYVVYAILDPVAQKFFYVGQTGNLRKRIRSHLRRSFKFCRHPPVRRWLYDVIHSDQTPTFAVFESCIDEPSSLLAETKWIDNLSREGHPLLNNWNIHKEIIRNNGISRR
ncbi:GIY-YIG nuclease family protein [Tabrizicola sp.]|uniref:GIY-YIG nuclease family protein n=1 Tax=Tabrizicola sp. TaxID=2005166 RepID=UPI003F674A6D